MVYIMQDGLNKNYSFSWAIIVVLAKKKKILLVHTFLAILT